MQHSWFRDPHGRSLALGHEVTAQLVRREAAGGTSWLIRRRDASAAGNKPEFTGHLLSGVEDLVN